MAYIANFVGLKFKF